MTAFNIWGNVGNQAYALPMNALTPTDPTTDEYVLAWDPVNQAIAYVPVSIDKTTGDISTQGILQLATGKYVSVDGKQIISDRKLGWAAATGTATRTTFDAATVTLPQLAERMKALLDDLTSHGLIGSV